jgi:CelD/BcsL family acetyltransferase involved in cellulose biosynthesis
MIESITSYDGFERLSDDWRELQRRSASRCFFLTWEWLFTWWKHLSAARRLMILVVRRHGRITAIAPFAIRPPSVSRLLPYRAVELLGTGSVGSDYLDLIVERGSETDAIQQIAGHLEGLRLPLELPQVLLEGSSARLLADRLAPRGWQVAATRTNVCPFIRFAGTDWPSYTSSLGKAHRANLHRRIRGLQRIGSVRFEPVRSLPEKRVALARLMTLHNERQHPGGSDAFHTRDMVLFHQELSGVALRNGWLRLMVLHVGQAPVAYFYGFRYETIHYFYQSAFDPAWEHHSVGLVAMGLAIRGAIEEGAAEFDLLHGAEPYKYHWAHEERAVGRMEIHPPFLRGWLTSGTATLGRVARAMGRSLLRPPGANPLA